MIFSYDNIGTETALWERVRYYNLNSLYNKLKPFIKKCFDNDSKYLSDRDFFMMNNMEKPENNVYMPKETIDNKGDVIVPCQISSGTLPSVENTLNVQGTDSYYCSDISISITLDSSTTIAQFSDAVVSGNSDYQYGDQISLILTQQFNDTENDVPHTSIVAIEVTLDQSDSRLLSSKSNDNAYLTCFGICGGSLAVKVDNSSTPENLSGVSPVWVHSRLNQSGNILVSTQFMYDCNPYADAHDTALMSYDLDFTKKKFLEPDESSPVYLTDWQIEGNTEVHNQQLWSCGELGQDNMYHIKVNNGVSVYDIKLNEPLRRAFVVSDTLTFGYKNLLPIGYKKCSYLEFDGNCYFNSNVKTKSGIGMTIKFRTTTEGKTLIGARNSDSNSGFIIGNFNSNGYGDIAYGGATANVDYGVNVCDGNIHTVVLDSTQAKIDDVDLTFNRGTFSAYTNIYVGTQSNNGSADSRKFIGRVYNVTLYDTVGTLFFGIPCIDDNNVPCFYDLVSKKAIYKSGSGTLTYEIDTDLHKEAILIRPIGTYTFSSSSTFTTKGTAPSGMYRFMCSSVTNIKGYATEVGGNIMSPIYNTLRQNQLYRCYEGIAVDDKGNNVGILDSVYSQSSNINTFKQYISGQEIIYELTTPTIEVIPVPLIAASPTDTYTQDITYGATSVQWTEFSVGYENIYAYGVKWLLYNDYPGVVRIGNMSFHASLPVQSQIRCCLLNDNGEVTQYLTQSDWNQTSLGDETHQVMLELPEFWWKFTKDDYTRTVMLSSVPINGYTRVPKMYVSAYEATVDRGNADGTGDMSTWKLASVKSNLPRFRGGNNDSTLDSAYNTQLCKAATMISESDFRIIARRRKANSVEWNSYTYLIHRVITWLFVVEYATRNSQDAVSNSLTTEGYHKGGLGVGTTNANKTEWTTKFGDYPFVPIGQSDSLGNGTGEVAYESLDGNGATWFSGKVARYRGMEHPFGHMVKVTEGIHIETRPAEGQMNLVYVCDNPVYWNNDNNVGYTYIGDMLNRSGAFSDVIFENGDLMPNLKLNGSNTGTFYCDELYASTGSNPTTHGCISGSARTGQNNGLFSLNIEFANPNGEFYGTRLCFIPNEQA